MFLLNLHASYHGFNLLSLRKDIDLCSEEEDVYWFVGMVGMVSLNALLLVCSGFDRWGSWWSRSIEERWVKGASRRREGKACILEKETAERWVRLPKI